VILIPKTGLFFFFLYQILRNLTTSVCFKTLNSKEYLKKLQEQDTQIAKYLQEQEKVGLAYALK
jgi:hypothetical protein